MKDRITLKHVAGELPDDFAALRLDASQEGYRFIERLLNEWNAGVVQFDKPREVLLIARYGAVIAGVAGVTVDPFDKTAMRMRRSRTGLSTVALPWSATRPTP